MLQRYIWSFITGISILYSIMEKSYILRFSRQTSLSDALLGIGMAGELRPPYDRIVQEVNQSKAKVVSVDIPSGVNAEQAMVFQAVRADVTYMVQYPKQSAFFIPCGLLLWRMEGCGYWNPTTNNRFPAKYHKYTWGEKEVSIY